ncbi:MAG: HYR domain-containing protein, partial [Saprospiraceae bacterium]|nr:HYR domain-containing protein [Saprospiraceae bacterium]
MIKNLPRLIHPSIWLIAFLIAAGNLPAWSQCTNSSQFGTVNAPTNNVPLTITTCAFGGEYSTINSCTAGSSYQFSATGGTGNYLTVRQGSPGGTVLGFGFSPITVTCTVSGPLYLHYNTDAGCGTDGTCHTGVVTCTSCSGGSDPCVGITTLSCGTAVTAAPSGTGIWSNLTCGFSTPGQEKIYSFTAPTTGAYSLQVNSVSGGYIDYMYKAASGGCSSTGWTCIDDINFTGTFPIGTLTGGTTYYILLDPEGTGSYSHNFQIVCPSTFDPCASISTLTCGSAVTATPSGAGVWSNATCGFSTPGQEKIYSFTPTLTGTHSLQVNSVSGGYIDYMYKVASGGCNSTGWTCIDDINFTGTFPIGTLTAGTTYYILLDPEGTGSYSHNFQIVCPTFDPCTSITTLSCDAAVSTTQSGSGLWSPGSCGFSTPGQEKIYSFTPITTGAHSLQVNSTSNTTYIDYFYKPASGGCNSTGWTCIDDVFSAGTYTIGTLTAGTTYYILLDPESTISVTQNFQIVCPPPLGPPPCVPAPTSPTNGQSQICPSATQSLSWPASGGATSYDVYFGTTNPPPFVANTASTSYNASTPTNTTYYWEIRPVGPGGTAAGCTVWNFNKSDVTPPSITCPGNISVPNTTNACSAIVTYTVSGGDNCSAPSLTLISGLPGGSVPFPVGVTVNTWRATDASNNSATCSFTVTVNDTQLPNITCPANIVTSNAPNLCSAVVTYSILGSDNCTAPTLTLIGGLSSGSSFPVGVTTNTWRATDQANNTRTCSFTVTVNDTQKPVITCPANIVRNNDPGKCYAVVTYP